VKIIFNCIESGFKIKDDSIIQMPCVLIIHEATIFKAFENGADTVEIIVCKDCKYHGVKYAAKRIERVRKILKELNLNLKLEVNELNASQVN
jgi:coenzyme F420-reducing hydrogenase delta subunit